MSSDTYNTICNEAEELQISTRPIDSLTLQVTTDSEKENSIIINAVKEALQYQGFDVVSIEEQLP